MPSRSTLSQIIRKPIALLFCLTVLLITLLGQRSPLWSQDLPLVPTPAYPEIRGVWITNNDTTHFMDQNKTQESVNLLAKLNFNTLYPVVWNSGYVLYNSPIGQQEGIQPFDPRGYQGQDVLSDLIARAHQQGLLVLPWFEFGFMAPPTSELVSNHPQWVTQRQDGSKTWTGAAGEVVWLNPFHPQVQKFITDLVLEVVTQYDVDGIQFDDHLALPNDFGYDPYTIALYQKETKKSPPSNPNDTNWMRWRANKITTFVAQLNKAIKDKKPNILFSLSPAIYGLSYYTYLQDWLDWIRKGLIDEVIVQVYRTNLSNFIEPIQRAEFQEAKTKIPTAVGILTGLKRKQVAMPLVTEKVKAAEANGLGVAFFYYTTLWDVAPESPNQRQAVFQSLFATPARRSLSQKFIPPAPAASPNPSSLPNPSPKLPQDGFPPEPTL